MRPTRRPTIWQLEDMVSPGLQHSATPGLCNCTRSGVPDSCETNHRWSVTPHIRRTFPLKHVGGTITNLPSIASGCGRALPLSRLSAIRLPLCSVLIAIPERMSLLDLPDACAAICPALNSLKRE